MCLGTQQPKKYQEQPSLKTTPTKNHGGARFTRAVGIPKRYFWYSYRFRNYCRWIGHSVWSLTLNNSVTAFKKAPPQHLLRSFRDGLIFFGRSFKALSCFFRYIWVGFWGCIYIEAWGLSCNSAFRWVCHEPNTTRWILGQINGINLGGGHSKMMVKSVRGRSVPKNAPGTFRWRN